jgi:hypothetical protein
MRKATLRPMDFQTSAGELDDAATVNEKTSAQHEDGLQSEPLAVPTPTEALAATASVLVPPVVSEIKQFIVGNHGGRNVMLQGGITLLRQGKVVDDVNYDIAYLQSQGVQLQPFAVK